jgi:hypothetical protein
VAGALMTSIFRSPHIGYERVRAPSWA